MLRTDCFGGQDLYHVYLADHELETVVIIIIITVVPAVYVLLFVLIFFGDPKIVYIISISNNYRLWMLSKISPLLTCTLPLDSNAFM